MSSIAKPDRIGRNTMWLAIAEAIGLSMSMLSAIVLARHVGDHGYGLYSFGFAVASFLSFLSWGIWTFITTEGSKDCGRLKPLIDKLFVFNLVLVLFAVALLLAILQFTRKTAEERTIVYLLAANTFIMNTTFAPNGFLGSVFRVHEQMGYEAAFRGIAAVCGLGVVLFASWIKLGLRHILELNLILTVIVAVAMVALVQRRFLRVSPVVDFGYLREIVPHAVPLMMGNLFVRVYTHFDTVMLSWFVGAEAVGQYHAAFRIIEIPLLFIVVPMAASFPALSRLSVSSARDGQRVLRQTIRLTATLSFPIATGVALFADPILEAVYGGAYRNGAVALMALAPNVALVPLNVAFSRAFLAHGRRDIYLKTGVLGAVASVLASALLVRSHSLVGTAIGRGVAELAVLTPLYVLARRQEISGALLPDIIQPLAASAIMAVIVRVCSPPHLASNIALAVLAYSVALGLMPRWDLAQPIRERPVA